MIGFSLPQFAAAAYDDIGQFASEAERLGADSLWVSDRLLAAVDPSVGYRGSDEVPVEFRAVIDPFTALTVAATATSTVRLGISVMVAPLYRPVLLARQLSSIDVVSNGRLMPGFGLGWSPEEYQAAGAEFSDRGGQLDEVLDVLSAVWGPDPVSHEGKRWSVPPSYIGFKPTQTPHPPVYLSAFKPAGLRRIGTRADGWLPVVSPSVPVDFEALARDRRIIDEAAASAGRSASDVHTYVRINIGKDGSSIGAVADTIRSLNDGGYPDTFVDLMYAAPEADAKLYWVDTLVRATT